MANTYTLISSNVLGSAAASVTFSAIPSTYTDLVLRMSIRDNYASVSTAYNLKINGVTTTQSATRLYGTGSAAASNRQTSLVDFYRMSGASATANTFGSLELYIPNYAGSANKVASNFGVAETNATAVEMGIEAFLWRNTAAITSLQIDEYAGSTFAAGSSFYLYGIKNS